MKRWMVAGACTGALVAIAVAFAMLGPARGAQHGGAGDADEASVKALRERVARLEKRVAQMERLQPTFAAFMPQFSERFHVLHQAGEAEDWQVAAHELAEMRRLVEVARLVDAERGELFDRFMTAQLDQLNAAVEHSDPQRFNEALNTTIANCNACHQAVGSGFIRVTLDVPSGLSMRHAHEFLKSSVEEMEHTHSH